MLAFDNHLGDHSHKMVITNGSDNSLLIDLINRDFHVSSLSHSGVMLRNVLETAETREIVGHSHGRIASDWVEVILQGVIYFSADCRQKLLLDKNQ
jgi:hypothetical protein